MTKVVNYNWPVPSNTAVALAQTVGAGANMILNGTLSNIPYLNPIISFPSMSRTVSLTSTANLSGQNFTITGTYLGKAQTQTIAGPNNNTVESTVYFDNVSSILSVSSTGANTVSAGFGSSGHTYPFKVDNFMTPCALSAHVIVTSGAPNLTYTFYSSCQEMDVNFSVNNGATTMFNMISQTAANTLGAHGTLTLAGGSGAGAPTYSIPVYAQTPIKWCWIKVVGSLGSPASMLAYILQQGLK